MLTYSRSYSLPSPAVCTAGFVTSSSAPFVFRFSSLTSVVLVFSSIASVSAFFSSVNAELSFSPPPAVTASGASSLSATAVPMLCKSAAAAFAGRHVRHMHIHSSPASNDCLIPFFILRLLLMPLFMLHLLFLFSRPDKPFICFLLKPSYILITYFSIFIKAIRYFFNKFNR